MHVGFTGTQQGMTRFQTVVLREWIENHDGELTFHGGDCIGSDEQAYWWFRDAKAYLVGHIPDNDSRRAFLDYNELRIPRAYLVRNHDIVDESEFIIGTPGEATEVLRSGTWATIRYAKKKSRKGFIILPDGKIENILKYARL